MAKVNLDVPDGLHRKIKQKQLDFEEEKKKISLKDLYYEIIQKGLDAMDKEKISK